MSKSVTINTNTIISDASFEKFEKYKYVFIVAAGVISIIFGVMCSYESYRSDNEDTDKGINWGLFGLGWGVVFFCILATFNLDIIFKNSIVFKYGIFGCILVAVTSVMLSTVNVILPATTDLQNGYKHGKHMTTSAAVFGCVGGVVLCGFKPLWDQYQKKKTNRSTNNASG